MKKMPLLGLAAVCLLAQCNKSEPKAGVTPVAAAAALLPTAPSVPIVEKGASEHFTKVVPHLELGGKAFTYADQDGLIEWIASLIDDGLKSLPEDKRKDVPANFSAVKIAKLLGLTDVKAAGASSRKLDNKQYHTRTFALTPGGRQGILTLFGGEAEPLITTALAPKGTDLAVEFPLRTKELMQTTLKEVLALLPEEQRIETEAKLNEQVPMLGITNRELGEKLDARIGLFVQVHPDQQLPIPGKAPIPGADALLVVDRIGWLLEPLKQQFLPMVSSPESPATLEDKDGVLTITLKQPVGPAPMDFQPVLRYDSKADRLILATRVAFLQTALAGKDLLKGEADFKTAWEGLPDEGNVATYASPRLLSVIRKSIRDSIEAESQDPEALKIVDKVLGYVDPYISHGQSIVTANQKDGVLTAANAFIPLADSSSISQVYMVAVMASIASPMYALTQPPIDNFGDMNADIEVSPEVEALVLNTAILAYQAENDGKYPESLDDVKLDEDVELTTIWLYNPTLKADSPDTAILLANDPELDDNGNAQNRWIVRKDGTIESITEEQFQEQSDNNLQ